MGESEQSGGRYWNPNWEVDHGKLGDLTRAELLVKECLARHCGANGSYPGITRIAKLMKLSERSVQRALRGLEFTHGLITAETDKKGGRGRSVRYRLLSQTWKEYYEKGD